MSQLPEKKRPLGVVRGPGPAYPADTELVERALAGDRWAEEALFGKHAVAITALATRLLRHRADAEDVVQETFLTALTELDRLRQPSAFRLWLVKIAVRKVHRRFRTRRVLRLLGLDKKTDDATLEALASPAASPEVKAELALVDAALDQIAPADRIAWTLRFVEGASLIEAAIACGCSLATVKRRITRAQERIGVTLLPGEGGDRD